MRGHWLATPVSSRKTRRGIRASIVRWLAKDHDRARASPGAAAKVEVNARNAQLAALRKQLRRLHEAHGGEDLRRWIDEATDDRNIRNQLLVMLNELDDDGEAATV
jgi:hypothetical protein